jgi:hypothetical protein
MPVNEEPEVQRDPRMDQILERSRHAIGASDRMPVRVILLFIVSVTCAALAPIPANIVGVAAVVLLALDTSLHRR